MTGLGVTGNLQTEILTSNCNWNITLSEAINTWLNDNPGLVIMDMQYQIDQTKSGAPLQSVLIIFKKEGRH